MSSHWSNEGEGFRCVVCQVASFIFGIKILVVRDEHIYPLLPTPHIYGLSIGSTSLQSIRDNVI